MASGSFKDCRLIKSEQDLLITENSQDNSDDSPCSAMFGDNKIDSTSSSKRRRGTEKRVISVPIKEVEEGFRVKGDHMSAPPSDSWAWRKYGQKPIKGSPYPRGYYKCSSSKGCPARKQVERSKVDPNMLLVTYTCEHNHHHHRHGNNNRIIVAKNKTSSSSNVTKPATQTTSTTTMSVSEEEEDQGQEQEQEKKQLVLEDTTNSLLFNNQQEQVLEYNKFTTISEGDSEFRWFDFEPTNCTMLECPVLTEEECNSMDNDMAMAFTMREEESFFADLGELPECSTVFRREIARAEQQRHSLATTS